MYLISAKTPISTRKHSSWLVSCLGNTYKNPQKQNPKWPKLAPQRALCLAKLCFLPMRKQGLEEGMLLTEKMPLIFLELQEHWYSYYYNSTYKHRWTLGIEILVAVVFYTALFINACKTLWDLQLQGFYRENFYIFCSHVGLNPQLKAKPACYDKYKGHTVL